MARRASVFYLAVKKKNYSIMGFGQEDNARANKGEHDLD